MASFCSLGAWSHSGFSAKYWKEIFVNFCRVIAAEYLKTFVNRLLEDTLTNWPQVPECNVSAVFVTHLPIIDIPRTAKYV